MKTSLQLCFLWHMHQPDYRDADGIIQMPWVFLHAIKDYYDMPWMLARHSGLKATFNITPPLIEQIHLYSSSHDIALHDRFFQLWLKNPSDLHEADRQWMIKTCKSIPYDTMVKPIAPYQKLFHLDDYDDQQLCDMEVWFVLAWCGIYLRTHNEMVKQMLHSHGGFDCGDKRQLLDTLISFIKTIFPYYAKLQNEGVISLSTTPFNHPILPLLIDMENASAAHPGTNIPDHPLSLKEDAKLQISKAQELFKTTFGHDAIGFWPAEGAVDEKSLGLYRDAGLKWVATDEAILFKSLHSENREHLYHPYRFKDVTIGFRDHGLSDLIGFTYRFWEAEKAADHFVSTLHTLRDPDQLRTLFVILDGENAWEFYDNNAFDFFDALYEKLSQNPWCEMIGMDEIATQEAKELSRLAPGSWIHGEFNTWVGHDEKTRGWELIYLTRRDYEHHKEMLDDGTKESIMHHFLAAECSDWFWWYGDDHHTEFALEFDELFRSHLLAIYNLMRVSPPSDLFMPIISSRSGEDFLIQPKSPIEATINGEHNSFFEWVGSGVVDETKLFTTMDRVRGPIEKIRFGENGHKIFCAFEGDMKSLQKCDSMNIIVEPMGALFEIPLDPFCNKSKKTLESKGIEMEIACSEWLELCMDFHSVENREVQLRVEIKRDGIITQTLPGYGELEIKLGSTYAENWFI